MKKLVFPFALGLSMMISLGVNVSAQNTNTKANEQEKSAAESVRLYYNRSGEKITELLNKILGNDPSKPYDGGTNKALAGNNEISNNATNQDGTAKVSAGTSQNIIVVYGKKEKREELKRVIAILDLPRERVNMEMWGILISSNDPKELAKVMREVNQEIEKTQKLLRETYIQLEALAKDIEVEPDYKYLFETVLGYNEALDKDRPSLSMTGNRSGGQNLII